MLFVLSSNLILLHVMNMAAFMDWVSAEQFFFFEVIELFFVPLYTQEMYEIHSKYIEDIWKSQIYCYYE